MGSKHKPTDATAAQVESLSAYGIRHDEIAKYLDIDPKTLRKHYRKQLDGGTIKANAAVARALHKNATDGNNVTAQIFWLKARAQWRDRPEDTGDDGDAPAPVKVEVSVVDARKDADPK